jgi:hypothetical protein
MSRIELAVYRTIPYPHLVVRLQIPLEEARRRNAARPKPRPDGWITRSRAAAALLDFGPAPVLEVDNIVPPEDVLMQFSRDVALFLGDA